MIILNCRICGKEIFIAEGWTLSARDYQIPICSECKESWKIMDIDKLGERS